MNESEVRQTEVTPQWKREEVNKPIGLVESYESVGVVGVAGILSRQLQSMCCEFRDSTAVHVGRNTLMNRVLDGINNGSEELKEYIAEQVALIGTNDSPSALPKELEASRTPAPINTGEVAPNDIITPGGGTGVDPGPFIGEPQQIGASARIAGDSIMVTENSNVLSGDKGISEELTNALAELGVEPKEAGLDLRSVFFENILFEPDELAIDVDKYRADIQSTVSAATNLFVNAVYPTTQTTSTLITKATSEAKAVSLFASIESPDFMPELISKADAQLRALTANISDEEALPGELRGVSTVDTGAAEEEESTDERAADAGQADAAGDDNATDDDGGDKNASDILGPLF